MRSGSIIAILVLALFVFGVVMVSSARLTPLRGGDARIRVDPETGSSLYLDSSNQPAAEELPGRRVFDTLLGKDGRLALAALVALAIGAFIPIERLASLGGLAAPAPWLVAAIIGLQLMTMVAGDSVHGATRWLAIGPIRFQPSEFAKWGLPAVVAWHCVRHADGMQRFVTGLLPPLALSAIVCALIAKEDLGTAALVMMVCAAMLVAAGGRMRQMLALVPFGVVAFVGFVLLEPYRMRRIAAFLEPYADAGDTGYQVIQSMGAIAGGGIGGRGLGHSLQKFDYLPFDHTDFIFAIICEELGIFGAALLIMILAGVVLAGLSIITGRSSPAGADPELAEVAVPTFSRLLGFGIILTFGLQAAINIAVVTGLAPTKGIALPLVSQGGTGWILTAFSLGLVISMDRHAWKVAERAGLIADPEDAEATFADSNLVLGEA
ncbi:MAG: Peptidoglycan glycosyltransferase FtsW [Planctomycetota bacterium]|jgi:cell division protein FtsW